MGCSLTIGRDGLRSDRTETESTQSQLENLSADSHLPRKVDDFENSFSDKS